MKTIYEFKKGDVITRIIPAKPYSEERIGVFGKKGGVRDRSFIGDKLIFMGILNGQLYFQYTNSLELSLFGDKLKGLALDIWDEGWELWQDPQTLLGTNFIASKESLEKQLEIALKNENYEEAEKLKKKINE